MALNALFGSSTLWSGFLFSFFTFQFYPGSYWGEYNKLLILVYIGLVFCNWGNREYLPTRASFDFKSIFSVNISARLYVLAFCLVIYGLFVPGHAAIGALFLITRFWVQSFDILVSKERKTRSVLLLEVCLLFLFVVCSLIYSHFFECKFSGFIFVIASIEIIRAAVYFILFRQYWNFTGSLLSAFKELKQSSAYVLNAFVGFLTSRLDFILSSFYLSALDLGIYQVMFNFVFFSQALATFIFTTYVFQFFRLGKVQRRNFIMFFFGISAFLGLVFLFGIQLVMRLYKTDLSIVMSLMLTAYAASGFFQAPYIWAIYKKGNVSYITLIGIVSMVLFIVLLFIKRAMVVDLETGDFVQVALVAQCFRVLMFYLSGRRLLASL